MGDFASDVLVTAIALVVEGPSPSDCEAPEEMVSELGSSASLAPVGFNRMGVSFGIGALGAGKPLGKGGSDWSAALRLNLAGRPGGEAPFGNGGLTDEGLIGGLTGGLAGGAGGAGGPLTPGVPPGIPPETGKPPVGRPDTGGLTGRGGTGGDAGGDAGRDTGGDKGVAKLIAGESITRSV